VLLLAVLLAALGKITVSGINDTLNICVFFFIMYVIYKCGRGPRWRSIV